MGMIPTFHLEKHVQTASGSFASTSPQGATGIAISAAWLVFLLTFSKQTRELLCFKGQNRSPSMIVTKNEHELSYSRVQKALQILIAR